jgi:hypothetical protein
MLKLSVLVMAGTLLAGCACGGAGAQGSDAVDTNAAREVEAVLDSLHDAASKADGARYFSLYTPDAVFLGTDETERWTLAEFRGYAEPLFAKGRAWTYTPISRHVVMQIGGWASFDELLRNAKYGVCRGSGSVRRTDAGWKVVQYNLSVPIPNDQLEEFAGKIRAFKAEHGNRPPSP